jgi:hypothetical protein
VCEANQAGSFEKASWLLKSLAGVEVSAKRAQLITERVGAELERERREQTERYLARQAPEPEGPPAALLVITLDGGRVQTRQEDPETRWKEDKAGVVYDATPAPERAGVKYEGPALGTRSVVATMECWDKLGDALSAVAGRRGYAKAAQRVCVADGAASNRSVRDRCFPDAPFILDWSHAVEHLTQTAQAAFGPGARADAWRDHQKDNLWEGRRRSLISAIARLSRQAGGPPPKAAENDPRRILANNLAYFKTNYEAINYPRFRQKGWPIGSGIIESTIKQLGKRVKGTEKSWNVRGVEQTLQVVAHIISEDGVWDDFWQRCPLAKCA